MDWIATLQPWHWLILGIILLVLETLGVGGFMIGFAIACLVQSALVYFVPNLAWSFQLFVFAINSLVFTFLYWKVFKPFNEKTDQVNINDRAAQMTGRRMTLEQSLPHGEGKVVIGDTFWRIRSTESLEQGDAIVVTGSEGMVLLVEKDGSLS